MKLWRRAQATTERRVVGWQSDHLRAALRALS